MNQLLNIDWIVVVGAVLFLGVIVYVIRRENRIYREERDRINKILAMRSGKINKTNERGGI